MALVAALAVAGAATFAACGSSSGDEHLSGAPAPANPAAFSWVHPAPVPSGWLIKPLPSGQATLAYPQRWRLTRTDPGTVTAALSRSGHIAGYLNITPQGGQETLANWASFRAAHNREEGDRNVVGIASATGLHFRNGTGSCVKDRYLSSSNQPYVEIACIVRGPAATTVIVGAAPPDIWGSISPALERSISSFDAAA
jgi:hypothetical protein